MHDSIDRESGGRSRGRSAGAVVAGLVTIIVLSLVVDHLLHVLAVYPPWGQPMHDPGLNLLAFTYRSAFAVLGGYVTARLAPHSPVRHALVLGFIGLAFSILGLMGAMAQDLGPLWYPLALVVTAVPLTWLGGVLQQRVRGGTGMHRHRRAA